MHEVLVNRLGGLSLPRKSVVRLTDRPDMTLDVNRGRKTTIQQQCRKILKNLSQNHLAQMHETWYEVPYGGLFLQLLNFCEYLWICKKRRN